MKGKDGGFVHIPKRNSRLDLQNLLEKYQHIRDKHDKYASEDRPLFFEKPIVPFQPLQHLDSAGPKRESIL